VTIAPVLDPNRELARVAEEIHAALTARGITCTIDGHRIGGLNTRVEIKAQYSTALGYGSKFKGVRVVVGKYARYGSQKQFPPRRSGPNIDEIADYIALDDERMAASQVSDRKHAEQGERNREAWERLRPMVDELRGATLAYDSHGLELVLRGLTEAHARAILEFLSGIAQVGSDAG
jgi:hypothetical protein